MKKNKIIGTLLILIGILAYLAFAITNKLKHKETIIENTASIGRIAYTTTQNEAKILTKDDKPTVIFFFNSDCNHCQAEAALVSKQKIKFKNASVFFFSTEGLPIIQEFAKVYKLQAFKVGKVDANKVARKMGVNTYPMCFIYSKEGNLLKEYKGEVKIEAIVQYLK